MKPRSNERFAFLVGAASVAAVLFLPAFPQAPSLPTADQILEKYVQAIGGKAAFEKLHSRLTKGTIDAGGGNVLQIEIHEKAPNKRLFEVQVPGLGTVRQGYDGSVGWDSNPQLGVQELAGAQLAARHRESQFFRWLRFRELFAKLEVAGTVKVGDRDAYQLVATPAEGPAEKFYFDSDTGLLLRRDNSVDTPDGPLNFENYYEDYRDVDGVKLYFSLRRVGPDSVLSIRFTEIKHNVAFDDAQFAKPSSP